MEQFKSYITEEKDERYRLMLIIYDEPTDPNITGNELKKEWAKNNNPKDFYQFETNRGYFTTNEKGNFVAHTYIEEKSSPNPPKIITDVKWDKEGFEIDPENTIVGVRSSMGDRAQRFTEMLRLKNVHMVNSRHTMNICQDKWLSYVYLKEAGLRQPRTSLVTSVETIEVPIKEIGGKYPMILKTVGGTRGVGVVFIESYKALHTALQLIYKIDENTGLILQEYIKTPFDVRVLVLNGEVVAQLKRPVIGGDFRSNISQGSAPLKMKLTELEKSECIKATQSVGGHFLGVDFIPSKDREKEPPYFIEVNGSAGTGFINELNDINIYKIIIDTYRNRDNWNLDK